MNPAWLLMLPFAGAVAWAIAAGLVAHFFAVYVFSKYPLVEDPKVDYDTLQAELDEEFAPLSKARRVEVMARLQ